MSFETDFPSLNNKSCYPIDGEIEYDDNSGNIFKKEDIQKFCLDKAKVREVIKACINANATPSFISVAVYERILKELGL